MGGKGKKKGKKSSKGKGKKKEGGEGDEETKNENEELKVNLPTFGWIKITVSQSMLRLAKLSLYLSREQTVKVPAATQCVSNFWVTLVCNSCGCAMRRRLSITGSTSTCSRASA